MKVLWSALAEVRALEAVDYIAQDRPETAAASMSYRIDASSVFVLTLRHWRRSWDASEVDDGA